MQRISQRVFLMVMLVSALIGQSSLQSPAKALAATPVVSTGITVFVQTADGKGIAQAQVTVEPLGLQGTTDATGRVKFANLSSKASLKTIIRVQAPGYRSWVLNNAVLYPNDTLQIDAPLSVASSRTSAPEVIDVPVHRMDSGVPSPDYAEGVAAVSTMAAGTNTTPPTSIRVHRVSLGRIDTVEFRYYVKHVLPSEWISSWRAESLKVGAMSSKTYSWYRTMYAKYPGSGYDTKDTTADQVYNPNVSYASTDAAVDATWGYKMTRGGAIFQSQYCAGSYNSSKTSGQCSQNHGWTVGLYSSQWGSKWYADNGWTWQNILTFYYSNIAVSAISGGGGGGPLPMPGWPVLREGDNNSDVKALQHLLRQRGYSITADGAFGPATKSAVINFQQTQGLTADGIAGANTLSRVIVTVRQGDNNEAVRGIQTLLGISADGAFGSGTQSSVVSHQAAYGLTQDGVVGPQTWQSAFGK